jgi:hypothetical protein
LRALYEYLENQRCGGGAKARRVVGSLSHIAAIYVAVDRKLFRECNVFMRVVYQLHSHDECLKIDGAHKTPGADFNVFSKLERLAALLPVVHCVGESLDESYCVQVAISMRDTAPVTTADSLLSSRGFFDEP